MQPEIPQPEMLHPEELQPEGQNMIQPQPHQPQPEIQEPIFANLTQAYPAAWTYSNLFWVSDCAWVGYQGWPFLGGGITRL